MPSHKPLGVGVIGAGLVTRTIHLPALARLSDTFRLAHVCDPVVSSAEQVAGTTGARHSADPADLLADPEVDVVAVCSPHRFHADQVVAACEAGKRAVLCEKPFAVSAAEAERIGGVSRRTGVPIVVGAMHRFDPAWQWARERLGDLPDTAHTIRCSVVLPPNSRYEDLATEVTGRPAPGPTPDLSDPAVQAGRVTGGVLGLATHDLPLIRTFLPHLDDLVVRAASALRPWGYRIVLTAAGRTVELHAVTNSTWRPEWTLDVVGDDTALHLDFTPSYVQAGSARAELRTAAGVTTAFEPVPVNGYVAEWQHLAALVHGGAGAGRRPGHADLADLRFALDIAEASAALIDPTAKEAA